MAQIADAVVFTNNPDLSKLLVEILKIKQVTNVVQASTTSMAFDAAKRFAKGLLIIDWAVGDKEAVKVLAAQARKAEAAERTILVIASEVSADLVATAAEYSVGQIYTEALDRKPLTTRIGTILLTESQSSAVKKTVSKIRSLQNQGKWNETLEPLKDLISKNPNDWNAKAELANTLLALGRIDEVKTALAGVEKTSPLFLRGVHILGRAQMLEGDFGAALSTLQSANALNPNDPDRLADIGSALLELNRADEAEEFFDGALAMEPDLREALVGKGKCLLVQENVNDALSILRGVTNQRELASIFNMSAVLCMRGGRHEAGMKLYMAAIKALGKNQKIHARLLFNMGVGYRRWQKPEKALQAFKKCLEYDPTFDKAQDQVSIVMAQSVDQPPTKKAPEELVSSPVENEEVIGEVTPAEEMQDDLLDFTSDFEDFDDDDLEEGIEYS